MKLKALLTATALVGLLAGCEQMMEAAGPAEPPPAQMIENAYVAQQDGERTLPAIPVERIPEQFRRQVVHYETTEVPGTIVINPTEKLLYFVTGDNQAIRYGISVGAQGFQWSGLADVTNKRRWPTWTPPPEMIERNPALERWRNGRPGSLDNPMSSRAIYLTTNGVDHGYRIHGTPDWRSIGHNASSGCIRMINQDVVDLYNRVPMGAKVIVLTADGSVPTGLKLPPPAPRKPKPAVKPAAEVVTPAADVATPPVTETTLPEADDTPPAPEAAPETVPETVPDAAPAEDPVTPPAPEAPAVVPPPVAKPPVAEPTPAPETPEPETPTVETPAPEAPAQ